MFTGRFPDELSANWEAALDDTYPTIAEILGSRGYSTGGFVANRIYAASEFGLDRGFQHYEDYPISLGEILQSSRAVMDFDVDYGALRRRMGGPAYLGMKDQREISRSFLRWLERVDDRPFFAFLNYFDAHAPYLPPAGFDTPVRIGAHTGQPSRRCVTRMGRGRG
jgi:arylsulfatase A-like enzyme